MNFDYSKFRVKEGEKVYLSNRATHEDGGFTKKTAKEEIERNIKELKKLQEMFYADDRYSLLIILQARDAAGKDGVIRHVMSGINPRVSGAQLQNTDPERTGTRLFVASLSCSSATGDDRDIQSLTL